MPGSSVQNTLRLGADFRASADRPVVFRGWGVTPTAPAVFDGSAQQHKEAMEEKDAHPANSNERFPATADKATIIEWLERKGWQWTQQRRIWARSAVLTAATSRFLPV